MSYTLCKQVSDEHPELDQTNTGASSYRHTQLLLAKLRAAGHSAYFVTKTAGEGQYTPPGFTPFEFVGFDGRRYTATGVSHDAVYCDGLQFDTLGGANEHDRPIYRRNGDPNWSFDPSDGPQITSSPAWNPIPQSVWRAWNVPMLTDPEQMPPQPPPAAPVIPGYEDLGGDAFFRAQIGVPLAADMAVAGQTLNDGSSVWFSRTTYELLAESLKAGHAIDPAPIVKKYRNQWRAILGQPPI